MHHFIDPDNRKSLSQLKELYPISTVVTDPADIAGHLSPAGLTLFTAQLANLPLRYPVEGLFKQWASPHGDKVDWYVGSNLWITYSESPQQFNAAYYHVQSVLAAWVEMAARDGLTVPTSADNPLGLNMEVCYATRREGPNSFSLRYGYAVPKGWNEQLRVWFKRQAPGLKHQWIVSNVSGPLRKKYANLVGWSI